MASDIAAELAEQVDRALADAADVSTLRSLESGAWPAGTWDALAGLGLNGALVSEAAGGVGLGFSDVAPLMEVLGRHAAPVPLAESIFANALLSAAGITPPEGVISFGAGQGVIAWGRHASHIALLDGARIALYPAAALTWEQGGNIAHEARDRARIIGAPMAEGVLPNGWGAEAALLATALMRAGQIAGAMQAALALAVDHANTRKQFGRPIGRFQAVQQPLAVCAADTSAASGAAAAAARAVDRRGLAAAACEIGCAKITVGEAATRGAAIAHQVFAAMGITEEHQLHHFTRRLWSWREEGGSEAFWAKRIGQEAQALPGAVWPFITAREEEITP